MAEPLKNMYSHAFYERLSTAAAAVIPGFRAKAFMEGIFFDGWEALELKQRTRHTSLVLARQLPPGFEAAVPLLLSLTRKIKAERLPGGYAWIFLPDMVELLGAGHFDLSVAALEEMTSLSSAEFAVRPFLLKYPQQMMGQMEKWASHADEHVRRLASEGCRPRLPWAMGVPYLKKEPGLILPVLEKLKADESEYVRRSVANNLNDISKDHPALVLETAGRWYGTHPLTDKLLKHACRSMIKNGDPAALGIFGFASSGCLSDAVLETGAARYTLGQAFTFRFSCRASKSHDLRLQYVIDFPRPSGKFSRKVFFLGEAKLEKGEFCDFRKSLRLQHFTTRKLHAGRHVITIMANGREEAKGEFYLEA